MASLSTDQQTGRKRIQFVGRDGIHHSVRLGKVNLKQAETVKFHVEHLVSANLTGTAPSDHTSRWIADLDDQLHEKLAIVKLVIPRQARNVTTLGDWTASYIESRDDLKPRTKINLNYARQFLCECFGENKPLVEITPGDGDEFRRWLSKRLAENTVRRHVGRCKQFFRAAQRKRLLAENPFEDQKGCTAKANPERFFFVTAEMAQKVLEACPDAEWRCIFALSRFGGLRCPSEVLALRWSDIDWNGKAIRVHSPKTEHHEGKESRLIPLFPELVAPLSELRKQCPKKEFVINRFREAHQNLRTQLGRIIVGAGLTPWPKLFQNCRSTRETELAEEFPLHVVCGWLGNSPKVATLHYLQTTSSHFETATSTTFTAPREAGAILVQHIAASESNDVHFMNETEIILTEIDYSDEFELPRLDSN